MQLHTEKLFFSYFMLLFIKLNTIHKYVCKPFDFVKLYCTPETHTPLAEFLSWY